MSTKHTPATPIDFRAEGNTVKAVSHGVWFTIARCLYAKLTRAGNEQNAAYIAHASNAYPRLVDAARKARLLVKDNGALFKSETLHRGAVHEMNAVVATLLRELGEEV